MLKYCFICSFAKTGQNQQAPLKKPPGEGNSQHRHILSEIEPERAPEMTPKHRKSLPNGRQQGGAFGDAPKGVALRAAPFGVLVVFHLVRISYVLASFPEPVLVRFSTKFADSENSLPQGAFLKGLPGFGYQHIHFAPIFVFSSDWTDLTPDGPNV